MQVSTSPLLFEFGVEKLYPISEGMIGGWLNIWLALFSFFFFFLLAQHLVSTFFARFELDFFYTLIRYNIISVIFLGIFAIPNIGVKWLSYVLPFSCFSVLPIMLLVKEEYRRRTVDDEEKEGADEEGDSGILSEEEK